MSVKYQSTKKYGHERGYSVAFRQWRASSHCHFLHGYALAFELTFEATDLDAHNWVIDFGGLKSVKDYLDRTFDHKTLYAVDDPHKEFFEQGWKLGIMNPLPVINIGIEAFSTMVFDWVTDWLKNTGYAKRVTLVKVQIWEHPSNSASTILDI